MKSFFFKSVANNVSYSFRIFLLIRFFLRSPCALRKSKFKCNLNYKILSFFKLIFVSSFVFIKAVQAHRDQYKDYTGKLHPLDFFKDSEYKYQCAPSMIPSYFVRYPTSYMKYKVPPILPLTYGRIIETPCKPNLALTGVYDHKTCIKYKK